MLHHLFSTPLIVLTLLSTFWCQQGSAEGLTPLSTVGLLPTSSFVTAIRQTTGIQPAEASSLATLPSAPPPGPSSSPLALFSTSLPPSVNDKTQAKEVVVAEKSPTTTQEVALLPRSGIRPRPAGIFAQCTMWWTVSFFPHPFPPFPPPPFPYLSISLSLFFFNSFSIFIMQQKNKKKKRLLTCKKKLVVSRLKTVLLLDGSYRADQGVARTG